MATSAGDEVVTEVSKPEFETVKSPETGKPEETENTSAGQSTQNEQPGETGQAEETKKATVETEQATAESVTVLKAGLLTKQGLF